VPGNQDWIAAAESPDPDDIRDAILAGYKAGNPFTPYVPTVSLPIGFGSVLDFGCGLGRNFPYLVSIAREVVGFDLAPMVERCRSLAPVPVSCLTADWDEIRCRRFDLIFASLVLQHIAPAAVRSLLEDFARLAPATYLISRARSDFGGGVFALVAESEAFDVGECAEVDHDPATHQLRIIGRLPFGHLCGLADDWHFEIVLRSRRFAPP